MTPAVASERSIFSKNHDYNNYIKESFPCRGEHVRTYISWGAVCVKTLFKKEAIDIFYISTTFIIYRRHLLYIDDIYYISTTFIIYRRHLLYMYIDDIYYISTTFIIYRRHLLYIDDIYYISTTFIIYRRYLLYIVYNTQIDKKVDQLTKTIEKQQKIIENAERKKGNKM